MLVDLHMHTSDYSGCSKITPAQLLESAALSGLEGVTITEHNVWWPEDRWTRLVRRGRDLGLRVFRGVEVTCSDEHDYLVVGAERPFPVERRMSPYDLVEEAQREGCLAIMAHPLRYHGTLQTEPDRLGLEAMEVMSVHANGIESRRCFRLCDQYDLVPISASDAHRRDSVGRFGIRLRHEVSDGTDLVRTILNRQFELWESKGDRLEDLR